MGKTDPGPAPTPPDQSMYSFEFPEFEMPQYDGPDYTLIQKQQEEEAEKRQAIADINSMYGAKFDAADRATAEINQQILDEASHASLRGLDYSVSEEDKKQRINNAFANYWSEENENQLAGLVTQWGDQGHVWDSGIERGTGTGTDGALPKEEKPAGKTVSSDRGAAGEDDESLFVPGNTVLGG